MNLQKNRNRLLLLFFFFLVAASSLYAEGEITLQDIHLQEKAADRYSLEGKAVNTTEEPREVILRGIISFFDRSAPPGDIPVMSLQKDVTIILKSHEERDLSFEMINEGAKPQGALRTEPLIRIRRERVWKY